MMDEELSKEKIKLQEVKEDADDFATEEENGVDQEQPSFDQAQVSLAQTILGERFEVLSLLGQGGMGSVYKVNDKKTERVVALKLMKPELCKDKSARKRFMQEAESLAELDNSHVVSVYDFGVADNGTPYLVMQYLEGGSLEEKLTNVEKLETDEAIELALNICQGLDYAHSKNLVHRDIKPSNVMVTDYGDSSLKDVMLADFGIAKLLKDSDTKTTGLTQTGDLFGTPAYMSPEQCEGTDIDHRSDIYSFGCLFYKMLTGKEPFAGLTPVQVAVKHISADPERFASNRADGDPLLSLEEIAFKCMRKNKAERYQSADEIAEDLKLVKEGKEVGYIYKDKIEKPGLVQEFKRHTISLMSFLGSVFAIFWYMMVVLLQAADVDSNSRFPVIIVITFGIFITGPAAQAALKNFRKRKTLSDWCSKLLSLSVLSTYIFAVMSILPPLIHPFSDIGVIALVSSIVSTVSLFTIGLMLFWGRIARNISLFFINGIKKLISPEFKPKKIRAVPMRLRSALNRIIPTAGAIIIAILILLPQNAGNAVHGISFLDHKHNGTFAEPLAKLALKLDPSDQKLNTHLANIKTDNNDPDGALKVLTEALESSPEVAEYLASRAKIYKSTGQYRNAIQDLNAALKLRPSNIEDFVLRGKTYMALGEYEKAKADFNEAIKITRIDNTPYRAAKIYGLRGLINYQQKKYKAAISDFGIAIEKGGNDNRNYVRRALAYNAIGERKKATQNLMEAVDANSYDVTYETTLVRAYAAKQLGNSEKHDQYIKESKARIELKRIQKKKSVTKIILGDLPMVNLE